MKVLLINPPIREWAKPNVLPLGLAYLAAVLRKDGHAVEVLDINAFRLSPQEVERRIAESDFDLVGIGAIVTVYKYVKWLAALLKQLHPAKPVVVGGSVGTSVPHIILGKTAADIVCIGEGEETIIDLVRALGQKKDLAAVAGIWFKRDGKIVRTPNRSALVDLDRIPFPAWDLFPMDIYLPNPVGAPNRNKWIDGASETSSEFSMNMSASRGCPYECTFCYHDFMGQKYRHRSVANLMEEMHILYDRHRVRYVHFIDDEFCLKKDFVMDFSRAVKREFSGDLSWGCTGRVNLMTEEMIACMSDARCVLIGYGIESGSQQILDRMKKHVTVAQAKQAIHLTRKYLGWVDCSFMIGMPGETRATIQETVDFCKELDLAPEVIFFATPYPGTELYQYALAQGRIPDEEEYLLGLGEQGEKVRVNFTDFSDAELVALQEQMIRDLNAWNTIKHT